jgi:hypothetical protein
MTSVDVIIAAAARALPRLRVVGPLHAATSLEALGIDASR